MKLRMVGVVPWLLVLGVGCLPDNPSDEGTSSGDSTGGGTSNHGPGGDLLGCPPGGCVMLLAVQTLDDRIEVFVPDHPDAAYRGAISLDLKPNECMGCGLGDNNAGRLDEPFGVARAGGFLHVLTGHYPTQEEGSLVAFPLSFFGDSTAGATVPVSDYFASGQFQAPVVGRSLGQREPIFMHEHASGRLVVGVFNNDLFAGEDSWTRAGRLLVIDPTDPGGTVGEARLDKLDGAAACQGASQVVTLGANVLGVACDGNEAVAVLDATNLGRGTVGEAARGLETGFLCPIPGAMPGKRVRYLAPDGNGGFAVAEGPGTTPTASARLWHMAANCAVLGDGPLDLRAMGAANDWQLGEIVQLPASEPTWLIAAGSATQQASGLRGVFVARNHRDVLELCPDPIGGFDDAWRDGNGGYVEPFALAVTRDAVHVAVGAGPYLAQPAGVGYGKVLWGRLSGSNTCSLTANVVDLTDGGSGHAPAPEASDPATFRRGPNVVVIQEISGG